MTLSPAHRANIGAARRARGLAFRASAVNGRTLADLHAEGAYYSDAARIMGWSESVVARWERDTGTRFARMPQAERNRRQSEALRATGKAQQRAKAILSPEMVEANAARMRAIWADPERAAAMVAKRTASRKANPAAAEQSRQQLRAAEGQRLEAMRAFFADDARWGAAKAKIAEKARERAADPSFREAHGRRISEARRKIRVEKGLAALDAGTLTEKQMRALIRDMTPEDRMIWMMKQDAKAARQRMRAAA